jgi:hypothetical protein
MISWSSLDKALVVLGTPGSGQITIGAAVSQWKPDHRTVTIYIVSFRFLAQHNGIFLGNIIRARGKRWAGDVVWLTERLSGLKTG